tara:strand:- start:48 stop:1274 length:1227 start_codon:yes stop_codon:yes gene_type:complete
MDPTSPSHAVDVGVVSTVKLGADGKERALLVRRGALRWVCLLATVLVLGCGGAWFVYESRAEHKVEMSRLTRLLRSTGERVQELRRVKDRLDDIDVSAYLPGASKEGKGHAKEKLEKLARELKLGSLVHSAQEEHERAQAAMMKQGMPSDEHAAAADQAARQVPVDMQRAMLAEFRLKGQFLVWSTTKEREAAWRKSPHFGKAPNDAVDNELDEIEDTWEDGELDTNTLVTWLRGNVSAGRYPPPVNVLSGIAGYLEDITGVSAALRLRTINGSPPQCIRVPHTRLALCRQDDSVSLFLDYDARKKSGNSHRESFAAAEATVQRVVALAGDEVAWHKDPTPTFKSVYAALVQFHLTEWLFPADDPTNDEGVSKKFAQYKTISEAEEDDDDSENDLEEDEEDDDEADEE